MKRSDYLEHKWRFAQMDPDYIVEAMRLSSQELLEAFPQRFEDFLKEEYQLETEEVDPTDESDRPSFGEEA